ncbi:TPA: hypothetical protein ACNICK_004843 [Escherichia coli]|uniref:hypothetical protein n=1 Tax=Escherichia coli TaxID=562 RepID=UPI0019A508AA|nr:hypothetical protein [Escherichia coli]CAD5529419.1 prophage protein [Escherichia coli]
MTTFTNSKLTDEYVSNATLIRLILWADQHNSHYVVAALRELQERRKADSVPVEINDDMAYAFHHALSDSSLGSDEIEEIKTGLRAAFANVTVQPVLIVPDEIEPDDSNTFDYVDGWNACREAMFQSGNLRENTNSSTNNFREIAETSTNYPVIPSEVLSAILKVAKIRADFDDFDGDRRGIGDCLDEAEQELIVTINKYASQIAAKPPQEEKSGNADCTATSGKTDNPQASGKQVEELTMLVKRLASSLKSVNKSSKLPDKAMDYLLRNGLVSVEGRGR